jgi:hypothetical protein
VRGKGQAKNGDKLFWEEKFHAAANGKAQAHTECALHFFLLSLGGGGGFRGGYAGLDCDCLILFFSLHPLGPLKKN